MDHSNNYNADPDIDTCSCSTNIKVPTEEIDVFILQGYVISINIMSENHKKSLISSTSNSKIKG